MPPKNPYLNQATKKKNTYQNVPTQKNPEIENFNPSKLLRLSLSLDIRSTPAPPPLGTQVLTSISYCERKQ